MSRKGKHTKKGSQDTLPTRLALATALIQLIAQLLEIVKKLIE